MNNNINYNNYEVHIYNRLTIIKFYISNTIGKNNH